jgi:hypothetical protein
MAHIIGEKRSAARGDSPMALEERNRYSNLILLCRNHHQEIDADEANFRVEVLHRIKSEHETWVLETLAVPSPNPDPDELIYATVVDSITANLELDSWEWFIDNAVRDLMHERFVDARGALNDVFVRTIWPGTKRKLERRIQRLISSFDAFVSHLLTHAAPHGEWLKPDRSYRRCQIEEMLKCEKREQKWSIKNFWLLCDYTVRLNKYAKAVREFLNPLYYRLHGHFIIYDHMGFRSRLEPKFYLPTASLVRKRLSKLDA